METVEEGVDIEDVDFSVDVFTGKLAVVIEEVSDVPVMLQSERNNNKFKHIFFQTISLLNMYIIVLFISSSFEMQETNHQKIKDFH